MKHIDKILSLIDKVLPVEDDKALVYPCSECNTREAYILIQGPNLQELCTECYEWLYGCVWEAPV
jgi:hypothetical protein